MKFNKIILFVLIIFILMSISAVSAEGNNTVISNDVDSDTQGNTVLSISNDINQVSVDESSSNGSSIISRDLTKYYKNASKYEAIFLNTDQSPLANTNVTLSINGQNYIRPTDGEGMVHFSINLDSGVYNLTATNPATGESVVNKVTVLPTISGQDITKYYKNGTQFYVNVVDGQGCPVSGKVKFNINGAIYERNVVNGTGRLNINLPPGNYTITSENLLNGEKISNVITVLSTISGKNITKYYKNGTQYFANLIDGAGNPLNGVNVTFNINGVFYSRPIVNGTARLNINLDPNTYTLTVINPVNNEQYSNTVTVLNKLVLKNSQSGGNVSIEYNNKEKYQVTAYYGNGTLATDEDVTFNINGVLYTRKTDANGTAGLTINLDPGDYVITAGFEGCTISNLIKVRITPDIKLGPTTVKVGGIFNFTLTQHTTGLPVTGNHMGIIYFNDTGWGAYPNQNGVVRFALNVPAGDYLSYIGMTDDGTYSSKWTMNTIKVVN